MKYLIKLITSWGYTQKYEVHDNSVQFIFMYGGGFQAHISNKDITKDNNWDFEAYNGISKHRETLATGESLEILKMMVKLYEKGIESVNPVPASTINLN